MNEEYNVFPSSQMSPWAAHRRVVWKWDRKKQNKKHPRSVVMLDTGTSDETVNSTEGARIPRLS